MPTTQASRPRHRLSFALTAASGVVAIAGCGSSGTQLTGGVP
ncbi:MAG: hypothetical protein ACR2MK_09790 [Solirubrobacteraceae bacterium]